MEAPYRVPSLKNNLERLFASSLITDSQRESFSQLVLRRMQPSQLQGQMLEV